jgi:hypothetical protein
MNAQNLLLALATVVADARLGFQPENEGSGTGSRYEVTLVRGDERVILVLSTHHLDVPWFIHITWFRDGAARELSGWSRSDESNSRYEVWPGRSDEENARAIASLLVEDLTSRARSSE